MQTQVRVLKYAEISAHSNGAEFSFITLSKGLLLKVFLSYNPSSQKARQEDCGSGARLDQSKTPPPKTKQTTTKTDNTLSHTTASSRNNWVCNIGRPALAAARSMFPARLKSALEATAFHLQLSSSTQPLRSPGEHTGNTNLPDLTQRDSIRET